MKIRDSIEPGVVTAQTSDGKCGDRYLTASESFQLSSAISLKRIADALDSSDAGGKPQGSVLWWLEMIASAANAGRS